MVQKTIKALYKQPVNYKLIRDGYKTVNGVIQAQDGMPATLELPTPSETYVSDLQYTVDINANGAPILNFNSFTLPDNEICESKQYCYAPKGMNYNYTSNEIVRHYDNFTTIGNPSIDSNSGIMTNLNTSNYLILPNLFDSNNNTWEMLFKVRTGTNITDEQSWIGSSTGTNCTYPLWRLKEGRICLYLSSNGSTWDICNNDGIFNVIQNTWYWMKLEFTGSQYNAYYSTNGTDYTLAYTLNSNAIIYQNQRWAIGANYWNSSNGVQHPWLDAIDLSQCYIKINNIMWWQPYRDVQEYITVQIPGMLDPSVTSDNWEQNQNYKLYQLKTQQNSNTLQLTENNITNNNQKYNQYINQITVPARNYKWYYHGIPEGYSERFGYYGDVTIENKIATFEDGRIYFYIYPTFYYSPFTGIIQFETGDFISNESLLEIETWYYNSTSDEYEQTCVYFSGIHNGKFSISNDSTLSTFTEEVVLSPNTKYWLAIYLNQSNVETYILIDNNDSKYSLPMLSNWTKLQTINFPFGIDVADTVWDFGKYLDVQEQGITYPSFTGKLYLENCIAFDGLTTSYDNLTWEAYYYYNYEYKWMTNKSIYTYNQDETTADTLNFSDSYINVSQYTYNQYKNKEVCLMPIDGGEETTHLYRMNPNYNISGSVDIDNNLIASNFTTGSYIYSNVVLPNHDTWEYITRFKIISATEKWSCLLSTDSSESFGFDLGIKNNKISWYIKYQGGSGNSISNSGGGNATISNNTWYWIKFGFDGTKYYSKYSTNGINYSLDYEYASETKCTIGSHFNIGTEFRSNEGVFNGYVDLSNTTFSVNNTILWKIKNEYIPGCLYNYNDDGSQHNFDVYYDSNYTQPILVDSGETYLNGTKVDTITLPKHKTWEYSSGGIWNSYTEIDVSNSNYTNTDGNLVLTEYTGNAQDVTLPNPEL